MDKTPFGRLLSVILTICYWLALLISVLIGFSANSFWGGLLSIVVQWLILDIVNISLEYVITGKSSINKSWLYRWILRIFNSKGYQELIRSENEAKISEIYSDSVDKLLPDLIKIIPRHKIEQILKIDKIASNQKEANLKALDELYIKTGNDEKYFESMEGLKSLDLEAVKTQARLKTLVGQAGGVLSYTSPLMGDMVLINHKLAKGMMTLEEAFEQLHKESEEKYDEFYKGIIKFSSWVAMTNLLIRAKESGDLNDKHKTKTEDIVKETTSYMVEQIGIVEPLKI